MTDRIDKMTRTIHNHFSTDDSLSETVAKSLRGELKYTWVVVPAGREKGAEPSGIRKRRSSRFLKIRWVQR